MTPSGAFSHPFFRGWLRQSSGDVGSMHHAIKTRVVASISLKAVGQALAIHTSLVCVEDGPVGVIELGETEARCAAINKGIRIF